MFVKDLMEKLSKMNPEQELIVEGFEDEVETTEEETVETPEEEVSVWDRKLNDEDFNDKQSQGVYNIIKNAHDYKVGKTGKMKSAGQGIDSEDAGIYADFNNNNLSTLKKLKTIAKVQAIQAREKGEWVDGGFGRQFDDETELAKYDEYKKWYDDWCASPHYNPVLDDALDQQLDKQYGTDTNISECGSACSEPIKEEAEAELDECGTACSKPVVESEEEPLEESKSEKCEKCGKEPCECEKEEETLEESAEVIEARLNEQMKSDYQKDIEMISDFLF